MCNEVNGWCKSFTKTEIILTILQLILFIIFLSFLVFLILHFLVCESRITNPDSTTERIQIKATEGNFNATTRELYSTTRNRFTEKTYKKTTFNKTLECTWSPSHKTKAQSFVTGSLTDNEIVKSTTDSNYQSTAPYLEYIDGEGGEFKNQSIAAVIQQIDETKLTENITNDEVDGESDGEEIGDATTVVLALVKVNPPADVTFGCILTVLAEHWTITAASCIEAIEEMDSLDAFVMMEDYGAVRKGRTHTVSDVRIHPLYEGVNRSYDLVALKSDSNLLKRCGHVELPSLLDYFMVTIGEQFTILGYGPFRTIDKSPNGKRLRKVNVYSLPLSACPEEPEAWALRHLWSGEAVVHAPCGSAPLCVGVMHARSVACNYCAGTPLLDGTILYGVMSEGRHCGVTCDPQLYVNIAVVRDWLDSVIGK